jgi:hypothetical protein
MNKIIQAAQQRVLDAAIAWEAERTTLNEDALVEVVRALVGKPNPAPTADEGIDQGCEAEATT